VYKAAIQLAVIGYGNKNFGGIRGDNNEIIAIPDLFKQLNIPHGSGMNEKFNPNQLTLRRLMRLLRYQVQRFIVENKRPSFLYLKYSDKDPRFSNICFPMGEHIVETKEEALYIYNTYKRLDNLQSTKFAEKITKSIDCKKYISSC